MPLKADIDAIDWKILRELQQEGRITNVELSSRVGISAPPCLRRVRRLEEAGIIRGYHGVLDSRKVGLDVTAFIGVSMSSNGIQLLEDVLVGMEEVLECHHVTGGYTVLLKVRTQNTQALERLISRVRLLEGVLRTETLVVLSTQLERTLIPLGVNADDPPPAKRANGNGPASSLGTAASGASGNGATHRDVKHDSVSEALEGRGERE